MRNIYLKFFFGVITILFLAEIIGRFYGLTSYPVFISDPDFEYISAPNQNTMIYRNNFITNEYSQRSKPIAKNDSIVILLMGDSVIYGGNQNDQNDISSTILENYLTDYFLKRIRVLNISSKSWGPDNCAAYLKRYGTFHAKQIILVVSSHDYHDNMTFEKIVGINNDSHPSKNYYFACQKLIEKGVQYLGFNKVKNVPKANLQFAGFNPGFDLIKKISLDQNISFKVYLHKNENEIKTGKLEPGGEEIRAYCSKNKIQLIEGNEKLGMYLDDIHPNKIGHKFLATVLMPEIIKTLKRQYNK